MAVIVRPEYASVFVRTVNRIFGTLAGAGLAALLLLTHPSPLVVAVVSSLAIGWAVLIVPKLYGLCVIGITGAALLSSSLIDTHSALPGIRMLDTVIGASVAIVFGFLLWPGARQLPEAARLEAAVAAARTYLDQAVLPSASRLHFRSRRDDAYRLAVQARVGAEVSTVEPPPVSEYAVRMIPVAVELEDVVDAITAVAAAADSGRLDPDRVAALRARLSAVEDAASTAESATHSRS